MVFRRLVKGSSQRSVFAYAKHTSLVRCFFRSNSGLAYLPISFPWRDYSTSGSSSSNEGDILIAVLLRAKTKKFFVSLTTLLGGHIFNAQRRSHFPF